MQRTGSYHLIHGLLGEVPEAKSLSAALIARGRVTNFEIPYEELKLDNEIARGSFAIVYQGFWGGMPVAIKKLKNNGHEASFKKECEVLKQLQMFKIPSVVAYAGLAIAKNSDRYSYNMVTEYLPHGTAHAWLSQYMLQSEEDEGHPHHKFAPFLGHAPWLPCYQILESTAAAIAALHSCHFVHTDIKPENLLMVHTPGEEKRGAVQIKLSDFGGSFSLEPGQKFKLLPDALTSLGSPLYQQPEAVDLNADKRCYGYASDVFSLGVVIYVFAFQAGPYDEYPDCTREMIWDLIRKGVKPHIPARRGECPAQLVSLIERCWDFDPEQRPTAAAVRDELKALKEAYSPPPVEPLRFRR